MTKSMTRRALPATAFLIAPTLYARAADAAIRIGCLTDLNGPYSDLAGKGIVGSIPAGQVIGTMTGGTSVRDVMYQMQTE